jgi:hypothetical protein
MVIMSTRMSLRGQLWVVVPYPARQIRNPGSIPNPAFCPLTNLAHLCYNYFHRTMCKSPQSHSFSNSQYLQYKSPVDPISPIYILFDHVNVYVRDHDSITHDRKFPHESKRHDRLDHGKKHGYWVPISGQNWPPGFVWSYEVSSGAKMISPPQDSMTSSIWVGDASKPGVP